ncbi:MAG: FAD-dependent oxidoreductase [Pseudomonadota bacterium]|nr:FAD-dependent oxidoreductase [Pseudomonadota bacterium]
MKKSTVDLDVRQALWSRRNFLKVGAGLMAGLAGLNSLPAFAAVPNIVVVGGGYGGATAAKYLKMWGKDTVNVTLIEPNAKFMSPIMSGMVVTSQLEVDRISFGYERLRDVHGVNIVQDSVTAVDGDGKTVTLSDGSTLARL